MAAAIRLSQQHSCSLDYLVSGYEQLVGHGEAQSLRGFEIDRQLERGRLQDRQFGRFRTLENAAGIDARLAIRPGEAGRIADQAACFDVIAQFVDRRNRMSRRQGDDLLELAPQNWAAPE